MNEPQGICPNCMQHCTFGTIASGMGLIYKCNNCWHLIEDTSKLQALADELKVLEEKRNALIATYR